MNSIVIPIPRRKTWIPRALCAAEGCSGTCTGLDNKYCSVECSNRARGWHVPEAELRFHFYRLGSRDNVARLYDVHPKCVFRELPLRDIDTLLRREMVNIGGILAKRCRACGVTRELEHYLSDKSRSGCGPDCDSCRATAKSLARRDT